MPTKNPVSRRRFLHHGLTLGAAGIGLPMLLPRTAWGADGQPGANERIGLGFIGMGRQATDLLKSFDTLPVARLVAVADVNLDRARTVAQKRGAEAFQDFRKLLERKDVDAVVTATPEHWRALICVAACQAGKDVYAEKPLSLTVSDGRLIVRAARKYNRVFQTGSQQRSMIRNRVGCEFIRKGGLGRIQRVVAHNYPSPWSCGLPGQPVPANLDWDRWCGPTEPAAYHQDLYLPRANPGWLSFRPYSGGEMTGWGAHGFDQVQWALGMDEGGPTAVWVEGPKYDPPTYAAPESKDRGDKICSQPKVFFQYPGDIVMELGDGPAGGALFVGEKGQVKIDRGLFESDPEELAGAALRDRPRVNENHQKNWLECIKSRARPVADVEIGHRSATVCHLGNIARWVGRKLRWDPVKETFPDDPEANGYLSRPYRRGWELPREV